MQWTKYRYFTASDFLKEGYDIGIYEWQHNYKPFKKNLKRIISYL